uniref:Vegetative incompatibility protein 3a n=2 Tax=Cryphonectria parasitica TaxID=5116 RepID=W1I9C0_CRYPA|nr:vegetative incompatibility protein 3a [Cryphonectria parasitica]
MIVFDSNCTLPNSIPGFVNGGNQRDTLDVLTSSLTILILCTKFRKDLDTTWTKIRWMIVTLLAPEATFARAVVDLRSCLYHTPKFMDLAHQDNVPWSRYHTSLADMGGFIISFPQEDYDDDQRQRGNAPSPSGIALPPSSSGASSSWRSSRNSSQELSVTEQSQTTSADADLEAGVSSPMPLPSLPCSASIPASPSSSRPISRSSSHASATSTTSSASSTTSSPAATPSNNSEGVVPPIPPRRPTSDSRLTRALTYRFSRFFRGEQPDEDGIREKARRRIRRDSEVLGTVYWEPHDALTELSRSLIRECTLSFSADNNRSIADQAWLICGLVSLEGSSSPLCAAQLLEARRMGLISKLPFIPPEVIQDKDKSDRLVKLAAIWQVLWLFVDLISREVDGLPSSPLEIMVLAFSVLALLIYIMLWFRPKDVAVPFVVPAERLPTKDELHKLALLMPWQRAQLGRFPNAFVPGKAAHEDQYQKLNVWMSAMAYSGMIFGSIHLLAWKFAFPTLAEQWLWRASALTTTLGPIVPGPMAAFLVMLRGRVGPKTKRNMIMIVVMPTLCAVFVARLFLLVEAYRSLYYLPPKSYLTSWTSNVPHVG